MILGLRKRLYYNFYIMKIHSLIHKPFLIKFYTALALVFLFPTVATFAKAAQKTTTPVYKNSSAPIESRINDLMSRMTLKEKVLQLAQYTISSRFVYHSEDEAMQHINPYAGSYVYNDIGASLRNKVQKLAIEQTRLGIPILFGTDVIHGFRSVFPIGLGCGCSWNTDLYQQACTIAAREARTSGHDWIFSPMVDVCREPRWGRIAEGYGEDPYTATRFAVAAIKGFQGNSLNAPNTVAACMKHYVGYGASEAGRDYVSSEISRQTLWETYLPPYEAGLKAGAASIMSAFNEIEGIPSSGNPYTLTEILRNKWHWNGLVVSDYSAVHQLVAQHVAANTADAAKIALESGVELDMCDTIYEKNLENLVKEKKMDIKVIDQALKHILRLKFRLGLFEKPYTPVVDPAELYMHPSDLETVRQLAEESFVLLQNNGNLLPLQKGQKIAMIGPLANDSTQMNGCWSDFGSSADAISIWRGMKQEFGEENLIYAKGCDYDGQDTTTYAQAVEAAQKADVVVLCLGEKNNWSGESASVAEIKMKDVQTGLLKAISRTGKPIVLLLSSGRPLILKDIVPLCQSVMEIWKPGIQAGPAVAHVLSGAVNPSGKLDVTFPLSVGQIPIYYNRRNPARLQDYGIYTDISTEPLYEFGFGLSYTTFKADEIQTSGKSFSQNKPFTVQIDVTNTGKRDGKEVVHWFVTAKADKIARPIKELRYFDKQMIPAGQTKTFKWTIDPLRDLGYVDSKGNHFFTPGEYTLSACEKSVKIMVK